ncbi:MAG: hypothetical protein RMJ43_03270 [Chloroherpetonaceae bacterium]|nr:hypothetical protein [Chloroherpetonaceae bacterium]
MALLMMPHTVEVVEVREDPLTGGVVPVPGEGVRYRFACQITPMRSDAAYQETGVMLRNPHRLMGNPEDVMRLQYGDTVVDGDGVRYRVVTPPRQWTALRSIAYGDVILEAHEGV